MNSLQTYPRQHSVATPVEPTAQSLPTLQSQLETLQNVILTIQNPTFRLYYGYTASAATQQLQTELSRVIGNLDPLLLEALAAYDIQA